MKSISDYQLPSALVSPPSRGAWIEILAMERRDCRAEVAPLAGGVD